MTSESGSNMSDDRPAARKLAIAVLALAVSMFGQRPHADAAELEYAVKAAYLYRFTPFVEWPASAFPSRSSPFYICVLGSDPFGESLDQALNGRQVGDHPLRARRLQMLDGPGECQILYLGTSRTQTAEAAVEKVRGTPVLTVAEQSLGVSGCVVQFLVRDGHVRFTIDAAAANANRVVVSAKLLSLAAAGQAGS
jgi:hypothetical protein